MDKRFGSINIKAVGVTFENRQGGLWSVLKSGQKFKTILRREPSNKYDANAVKILVQREDGVTVHVGYVPRNISFWLAQKMDAGLIVHAFNGHVIGRKKNTLGYACDIAYQIP